MFLLLPLGPDSASQCVGRCGVYVERGAPVRVLSGVGLYVEDDDHNEIFYMKVSHMNSVIPGGITTVLHTHRELTLK